MSLGVRLRGAKVEKGKKILSTSDLAVASAKDPGNTAHKIMAEEKATA